MFCKGGETSRAVWFSKGGTEEQLWSRAGGQTDEKRGLIGSGMSTTARARCPRSQAREARLRWFGHRLRGDSGRIGRSRLKLDLPGKRRLRLDEVSSERAACAGDLVGWGELTCCRTTSSRRIIQLLKRSDIILLLHTFHLSREDSATSQHNFSFHYSVGRSHACKVAGLVISTCQVLCPSCLVFRTLSLVDS